MERKIFLPILLLSAQIGDSGFRDGRVTKISIIHASVYLSKMIGSICGNTKAVQPELKLSF